MFKIGDFSKITKVSIRMLRYYDEMGLFKPEKIDDFNGYRYYSATQIPKLNLIVSLRDMGFNVADIALAIGTQSEESLKKMFEGKKLEIEKNILSENEKLIKINTAINNLNKERVNMSFNVTLKQVPSYKVVSLRDIIPTYDSEGILWDRMCGFIKEKDIQFGNISFATYHDEGYKEGDVDVEVVIEVKEMLEDEKGFVFKETEPIVQAASMLVTGDFCNIAPAFNYLGKWIEENGYTICGNARELPIKGPWNESNPDNYLHEIQIPVQK